MDIIRVFDRPSDEDLLPFSAFLWQQSIPHRITEEGGRQVLWIQHPEQMRTVLGYYEDWKAGLLQLEEAKVSWKSSGGLVAGPLANWKKMPATLIFLLICAVVAIITHLGENKELVSLFTITDFRITGNYIEYASLSTMLGLGQLWRVITPVFLHFGIFHFVFNMLWVLDFGYRIESRHKTPFLVALVLATGLISNIVQFYTGEGYPLFGGMSGVIYGLLGFCWVREKQEPGLYQVPSGIYLFMLMWLVIGATGVLGAFGFGKIANAAHVGGLLSGVLAGWLFNRFAGRKTA
ncbi:rhomboid family intramembrane serine protease [Sansalvadorimonas verongulae]|uniref:rhomboid family intramembrane serine protease n=1 Tax=Sansalvadorimonas verongulae TaxID=2172824 RepID=UPI0012BC7876|nr:rhomboid family intramembrane serine protease [Sansalvadorimonas verongulae]MTI15383.1 rhomboid family intramembrane serine protease [Sansalvadorimonas verongulae]